MSSMINEPSTEAQRILEDSCCWDCQNYENETVAEYNKAISAELAKHRIPRAWRARIRGELLDTRRMMIYNDSMDWR